MMKTRQSLFTVTSLLTLSSMALTSFALAYDAPKDFRVVEQHGGYASGSSKKNLDDEELASARGSESRGGPSTASSFSPVGSSSGSRGTSPSGGGASGNQAEIVDSFRKLYKTDSGLFWKYATRVFQSDQGMSDADFMNFESVLTGESTFQSLSQANSNRLKAFISKKENETLPEVLRETVANAEKLKRSKESSQDAGVANSSVDGGQKDVATQQSPTTPSESATRSPASVNAKSSGNAPTSQDAYLPITREERDALNPTQNPLMDILLGYQEAKGEASGNLNTKVSGEASAKLNPSDSGNSGYHINADNVALNGKAPEPVRIFSEQQAREILQGVGKNGPSVSSLKPVSSTMPAFNSAK